MMDYRTLLFSELRLVPVSLDKNEPIDEYRLQKAMTVNENIISLGHTLSPKGIIDLSKSPDLDRAFELVRSCIGEVKAKPMYPNFPSQVMEMDEAVFRFHQILHYMSTYGIEEFTGAKVTKGWIPEVEDTEKIREDQALLTAKVIEIISDKDMYSVPYRKILTRTERMTDKERMVVLECLKELSAEEISGVTVTFKQNLLDIFNTVFTSGELDSEDKLAVLHSLCQHTGDVFKCMDYALTRARYHFRTSQKRLIVKLLESYSVSDFRTNLILSNKKGERTILMLKFIDYNEYSRSAEHKGAVAAFRNGELRSWESRAKYLAENKEPEALDYYAERPGMMLRSLTYLVRKGYNVEDIGERLLTNAGSLKTQTLISLLTFFRRPEADWDNEERYAEAQSLCPLLAKLLEKRLSVNDTAIKGKKVYLNTPQYDLEHSPLRVTDKSSEGGYIRSGVAYRIPEDARKIRFFVYWNDKERVDIDLHGTAVDVNGENIHIGWNTNFKSGALVFSGDMTTSDSAEYIDLDLERAGKYLDTVSASIDVYYGHSTFKEIEVCFVGAMAVRKTGEDIKLYDPKNCFFTHYLTGEYRTINYGYIDVQNRTIVFDGLESTGGWHETVKRNNSFPISAYLEILFKAQGAETVENAEKADAVLVMGKPSKENEISLIDNNFFMEG